MSIVGGSPRAIGRAGAAVVGDDGGGALLINPAAMARRDTTRAELGGAVIEDNVEWLREGFGIPLSVSRAGSRIAPFGAAIAAISGWVVGIGATTTAVVARGLPRPGDVDGETPDKLGMAYDYRYAGIAGAYRRDTAALGVARRLGDSLALGVSVGASRVDVAEHRRIWASHDRREEMTERGDIDIELAATDPLVASAVAGVLYAPVDAPIELGASVGWTRKVRLDGSVAATGVAMGPVIDPASPSAAPSATLEIEQPIAVRAGGRYVGDRVVAELDGDLWIAAAGSESAVWNVRGVSATEAPYPSVELTRVPSRISQHTHVALRTAVDVAVVPGFLWLTSGYAFSTRGTPAGRLSPSFADLGGHTLALGLEAASGAITITLGWSRTWSPATRARSDLLVDSPFPYSNGRVPLGTYYGSIDQAGVLVEVELGGR